MKYENIEKFKAFLDENLRQPYGYYNFAAFLEDFERDLGVSSSSSYELSPFETKSRNPETIMFEREDHFLCGEKEVDPDDDWDTVETTIIF